MKKISFLLSFAIVIALQSWAQSKDSLATYKNPERHRVVSLNEKQFVSKPKNIILFIGDGMGVAQVFAGITANGGQLNLNHMKHIGFSQTQSASNYVTDSGAGGTAIATGQRVDNGIISVDKDKKPLPTILEISSSKGKSTGLVSTSGITHATPASFIAHQPSREMYEEIAADFLNVDIDIFIGGGSDHFLKRKDGRNIANELISKGYKVFNSLSDAKSDNLPPLVVFTAKGHNPPFDERGDMLKNATKKAIKVLNTNANGFFVMIEGSQIDWGGHENSTPYIVGEMLDLDIAIGEALKFAADDGETLVIVTADHETGGMTLNRGSINGQEVTARYTSGGHTAVMVPVFAYGPGADHFIGIYKNTDLFSKMIDLFGF